MHEDPSWNWLTFRLMGPNRKFEQHWDSLAEVSLGHLGAIVVYGDDFVLMLMAYLEF